MVRLLPRYSIAACGGVRRVRRERGKALLAQRRRDGSPRMHARGAACMTTAAESTAVNAPSVAHSVPSEEDRPSDVRPFDRATESARAAAAAVPASYASQPSWSPPLPPPFSSPFLSVLPRVARRLKTLFCPHTARSPATTNSICIWTTQQRMPLSRSRSTTKGNERAPGGTTAFVDRDKHTQGQIDT